MWCGRGAGGQPPAPYRPDRGPRWSRSGRAHQGVRTTRRAGVCLEARLRVVGERSAGRAAADCGGATTTSIFEKRDPIAAVANDDPVVAEPPANPGVRLTITFARSSSPTFPLVRKWLDALAPLGSLDVTKDDKGRDACFELTLAMSWSKTRGASPACSPSSGVGRPPRFSGRRFPRPAAACQPSRQARTGPSLLAAPKSARTGCLPPLLPARLPVPSYRVLPGLRLQPQPRATVVCGRTFRWSRCE